MKTIRQLRPVIEGALLQTEPHCGRGVGSGRIFTGNYDWHSSVHAHWALLSMARVAADAELRDQMLARLSPANLKAEQEFLATDVEFELPYGRAWLALLLSELERHPHGYDEMAQFRRLIETQVIDWLEATPFEASAPKTTGKSVECGSHQSWLFAYLLLQLSAPSAPIRARLDALFARIDAARTRIARARHTDYDFLYLPAVLRVIDATRATEIETPATSKTPGASKTASEARSYKHSTRAHWRALDLSNAHTAGAGVTRLWPRAFEGRFGRALPTIWKRREQWADDFHLVGHWVPQFIWLGALLEMDDFGRDGQDEK